ncbi:hypothetical protein CEP54_013801 [Fusarium duplospermum]|uniref:Amine oxidase n=1 Tax=Fusarium duplospermum TaxID=1325734 RepID=A0A428P0L8_9HYPO|nr:hypothetical protein CEP54_013801 [Fusarium duplospermum]
MPRSSEGFQWTPMFTTCGLETDSVVPSTPDSHLRETYDVVIIGAGFTGLVAGRDLSQAGVNPLVFAEIHRYNLHCRIKTSNGTFAPQVVHYKPAAGAIRDMTEAALDDAVEKIGSVFFCPDGHTSRELMPYPYEPFREPALWTKYDHLSIKDRLNQIEGPQEDKDLFEVLMSSVGSASGHDVGFVEPLRWYALGGHSVTGMFEIFQTFKLGAGGQTALARGILGDYKGHLRLGTEITKVDQSPHSVTVTTKSGSTIRAKYAICTIPLNCLPDITFNPPFSPLRQEAIRRGHMNQGAKFHFKLRKPEPGWLSIANSYGNSPFMLAFSDHTGTGNNTNSGTYMIGFGHNGHLGNREDSDHIISALKENMKPGAEVEAYLTHDWVNDPYSKGAWSAWGPGGMSKYLRELQKCHGRVLMSSADWANGSRGFVDGAIERGTVAARDIRQRLGSSADGVSSRI